MNELPKTGPDWPAFYTALGEMMHEFASMESALGISISLYLESLVRYPLESPPNLKAVVRRVAALKAVAAGGRVATLRDTLNRLLRVSGANEIQNAIEPLFQQLGEIHFFRDRLAHHPAGANDTDNPGQFYVSNIYSVRENEKQETIYFDPSSLTAMANDLRELRRRLLAAVLAIPDERPPQPWSYKPSQLVRRGPKSPPTDQAPILPPQSSGA